MNKILVLTGSNALTNMRAMINKSIGTQDEILGTLQASGSNNVSWSNFPELTSIDISDQTCPENFSEKIVFNEFSSQKEIELYNTTDEDIDMTGWVLKRTDENGITDESSDWYTFEGVISSKGYKVITAKTDTSFGLSVSKKWTLDLYTQYGELVTSGTNKVETTNSSIDSEADCVILYDNQTLGRTSDGGSTWSVFTTGSIGESNSNGTLYVKKEFSLEIPIAISEIIYKIKNDSESTNTAELTQELIDGAEDVEEGLEVGSVLYDIDYYVKGGDSGIYFKINDLVSDVYIGSIPEIIAIVDGKTWTGTKNINTKFVKLSNKGTDIDFHTPKGTHIKSIVVKGFPNKNQKSGFITATNATITNSEGTVVDKATFSPNMISTYTITTLSDSVEPIIQCGYIKTDPLYDSDTAKSVYVNLTINAEK